MQLPPVPFTIEMLKAYYFPSDASMVRLVHGVQIHDAIVRVNNARFWTLDQVACRDTCVSFKRWREVRECSVGKSKANHVVARRQQVVDEPSCL
jgi:hypothetical protein